MFSQQFIEKVREAANIADVIGQYTELKRSGSTTMGLCPFPDHNEKSPSFSVSEDRQLYYCFGCGKGGNIYTFLEQYRGLSFPEAVEYLANQAGIPLEVEEKDRRKHASYDRQKDEKKVYLKINQLTSEYYNFVVGKLPKDHPHRAYINSRGLTAEIIEKFKIGLAPDQWQALVNVFEKRKVPLAQAEKLGLIKKKNKGEGHFDIFRDRLMFPILSPNGETLGFGGRVLGDDHPKYLNSPETPVFDKGRTFYGLHETAKFIRTEDEVIVVEGYMDLIALYAVGIKNVVAILGTAFTETHARLINRYTKNVVMLLDGDSAGLRAAERSLPILLAAGLFPKQVMLAEGQDPDDFLKDHGVEALRERIKKAPEFYLATLDRWLKGSSGNTMDKVKLVDRLGPVLKQVSDSRLRSLYFRETVDRLGVEEEWLKKALAEVKTNTRSQAAPEAPVQKRQVIESTEKIKISQLPKAERVLLQLALKSLENWKRIESEDLSEKVSEEVQKVFAWMREKTLQNIEIFDKLPALLATNLDEPSIVTSNVISTGSDEGEEDDLKYLEDCIKWVDKRFLKTKAKSLASQLKGQPSPEQLEQFMNIQKQKRSLSGDETVSEENKAE